ncbi:MAG: zinc ABC transporter substrate-binding protein [Acidimicrobiales bacterium]
MRVLRVSGRGAVALSCALLVAVCVVESPSASARTKPTSDLIVAVGAESQYANVLAQIGGKYVSVSSILDNPNTDPHAFEASPSVAEEIAHARLVVQNGAGYDGFMNKIEAASPSSARTVIVAQTVLDLPSDTPNPHLWYSPRTMPAVARVIAKDLATLDPGHASYFSKNLAAFDTSMQPFLRAVAAFKASHGGTPVAVTEPVADDLLKSMGARILTPFVFQADIMNGVDPAPEDISLEEGFFTKHEVKVFCYNQQVVDSLTSTIEQSALSAKVPVVGVYETMPAGYDYQTWMLAEVKAITKAITKHRSTEKL